MRRRCAVASRGSVGCTCQNPTADGFRFGHPGVAEKVTDSEKLFRKR
jgi:hypothetical protein